MAGLLAALALGAVYLTVMVALGLHYRHQRAEELWWREFYRRLPK